MRAIAMACAMSAGGCQLLFALEAPAPDAPAPLIEVQVAHLADPVVLGSGTWEVIDIGRIHTSDNLVLPATAGVESRIIPQVGGGEVLVVTAQTITIAGSLQVEGNLPLILVADDILVGTGGVIDGAGRLEVGGPGSTTQGPGQPGQNQNTNAAGGGGGGFGTSGAPGASAGSTCTPAAIGGAAGGEYGDLALAILEGGGRGGTGGGQGTCPTAALGGGGGGAIQLTARTEIRVVGAIDVAGGGGRGGVLCTGFATHAGGGGGAGGAIYLEAPTLDLPGSVTANGGGGGGGGATPFMNTTCFDMPELPGGDGQDGTRTTIGAMGGPPGRAGCSHRGGEGGAMLAPTTGPSLMCDGSVGGGGGAVGRIVLKAPSRLTLGTISPAPHIIEE